MHRKTNSNSVYLVMIMKAIEHSSYANSQHAILVFDFKCVFAKKLRDGFSRISS